MLLGHGATPSMPESRLPQVGRLGDSFGDNWQTELMSSLRGSRSPQAYFQATTKRLTPGITATRRSAYDRGPRRKKVCNRPFPGTSMVPRGWKTKVSRKRS